MSSSIATRSGTGSAVRAEGRVRPRLRRVLAVITVTLVVLAVAAYFGISIYVVDQLASPPRRVVATDPAQHGMAYENVNFNSTVDNVPLSGWFVDSPGSAAVVMVHGRASARDDGPAMSVAAALAGHGYDVLLFDIRAHGTSGGDRYTMGQRETRDVAGAVRYLQAERGVTEVAGYGTSMGASTLLNAAGDLPEIKAYVLDSAFADLSMLWQKELPRASGLPSFFIPGISLVARLFFDTDLDGNKPVESMPALDERPVFLIHSEGDPTIPVEHAYMLQKAGADNTRMQTWIAPGEGHTAAYQNHKVEYIRRVLAFYDESLK